MQLSRSRPRPRPGKACVSAVFRGRNRIAPWQSPPANPPIAPPTDNSSWRTSATHGIGVEMQSIMHLALARHHPAVPPAQLFEQRKAESRPQQIAIRRRKFLRTERCQHYNRQLQAGQIERTIQFPLRQRQRRFQRQRKSFRRVFL